MARVVFHLDMDAFYASVEQREDAGLRGKPVIVGGSPDGRAVVCAASYEARPFGVRSAMPCATARRLCPGAIFVRPRFELYRAVSLEVRELMRATGALVQPVSIDEAYLELTALYARGDRTADEALEAAVPVARRLKESIRHQTRLTCSIGVAPNKLLAKIASDFRKPDGLTVVLERDKRAFLRPLPVSVIHGVGRVTRTVLEDAGIRTIGDLQDYAGDLRLLVGSWADELRAFAVGEDDRPLDLGEDVKSISCEETFDRDTLDRGRLRSVLRAQAAEIAERLGEKKLGARTIQIKVRYGDFTTLTRQASLPEPSQQAGDFYRVACHLLSRHRLVARPLRLLGLGVTNLEEPSPQLPLEEWPGRPVSVASHAKPQSCEDRKEGPA